MLTIKQVFDSLPENFSSSDFLRVARANNVMKVQDKISTKRNVANFLQDNANQNSAKLWTKKRNPISHNIFKESSATEPVIEAVNKKMNDVDQAIDLLKSKGFKVLRPISEWQEM